MPKSQSKQMWDALDPKSETGHSYLPSRDILWVL